MTGLGPQRGHKARADRRKARDAEKLERVDIAAERNAMYQAQIDAANAKANAEAALQARSRVTCPCCGSNTPVAPEMAARQITAVAYLPDHVPTNPTALNAMRAVVEGKEIDRDLIYTERHRGMHVPRRVYADAEAVVRDTITIHGNPSPEEVAKEISAAVVESMTKRDPATVNPKAEPIIPSKRKPSIATLAAADDEDD